ncbi:MAG TPA: hypothetical protein PKN04_01145 [bacterium]|nr:hypothetical protein [bacterium]HNT64365.1 hypothetical protein [bacterium]HOX85355.1 hypothetical protein [bacterium]HPG44514.1 hypothetical protein [bacterium]HPM97072.1 hypothetical protein [bacterium]
MNNLNLRQLVVSICAGNFSHTELIQFIHLVQKISLSYLKFQEILGKRIAGERMEADVELEDLALDCIAELFSRDASDQFTQLKRYFEPKLEEEPGISDGDMLILIRRLVIRKTKQELSRIFRERDPEGAKIVRNIKVTVRNSDKLHLFKEMGRDFIFHSNGLIVDETNPHANPILGSYLRCDCPPIPDDLLLSAFIDVYDPAKSVSILMKQLFEKIHGYEEYQNYISLDSIVKLVRHVKFDLFKERLVAGDFTPTPQDHLESKEIEGYVDVVMGSLEEKIQSQYLKTGKLSAEKSAIYRQALRDVLFDLIQKKDSSSYFRNLKYYIPELTQQEYRQQERSVFEYLAKVAKREFRKHLKELL